MNRKYQDMFEYSQLGWIKDDLQYVDGDEPGVGEQTEGEEAEKRERRRKLIQSQKRSFSNMLNHLLLTMHDDQCSENLWDLEDQRLTTKGQSLPVLLLLNIQYMKYDDILELIPINISDQEKKKGLVGLKKLGSICYLNSTI